MICWAYSCCNSIVIFDIRCRLRLTNVFILLQRTLPKLGWCSFWRFWSHPEPRSNTTAPCAAWPPRLTRPWRDTCSESKESIINCIIVYIYYSSLKDILCAKIKIKIFWTTKDIPTLFSKSIPTVVSNTGVRNLNDFNRILNVKFNCQILTGLSLAWCSRGSGFESLFTTDLFISTRAIIGEWKIQLQITRDTSRTY